MDLQRLVGIANDVMIARVSSTRISCKLNFGGVLTNCVEQYTMGMTLIATLFHVILTFPRV